MGKSSKASNDFESFLNECNTYIWEWYVPEGYVKFGIPSLTGLWINDKEKIFRLDTVLEKVHPDDVEKIFVRRTSPLYRSDKMFEIDLRVNVTGTFEWYGFRGRTLKRDRLGAPAYIRGVAINVDNRVKVQQKLLKRRDMLLQSEKQKTNYCAAVLCEVVTFIRNLASNADSIITGISTGTKEERLLRIKELEDQCERILELSDKVKKLAVGNDAIEDTEIRSLALWEHLAELQQVHSLKVHGAVKIYFSNLYDDLKIDVNVKLFDLLIENVVNSQLHNTRSGYLTISYAVREKESLLLSITCTENEIAPRTLDSILTENGMGLSVCRLLAKRMGGDVKVAQVENSRMRYEITLPLNVRKVIDTPLPKFPPIEDPSSADSDTDFDPLTRPDASGLPVVLIGSNTAGSIYRNQHLFDVMMVDSTNRMLSVFEKENPDIVFIDYNLKGGMEVMDLIGAICSQSPDTPVIVTADYAHRVLHKQLRKLGARYLITNPLSLRKVNIMIKKYLK